MNAIFYCRQRGKCVRSIIPEALAAEAHDEPLQRDHPGIPSSQFLRILCDKELCLVCRHSGGIGLVARRRSREQADSSRRRLQPRRDD
jgi:hypothetical protein